MLALFELVGYPLLVMLLLVGYSDRRLMAGLLMLLVTGLSSVLALTLAGSYLSDLGNVLALVGSPHYTVGAGLLVCLSIWVFATKVPSWPIYL